MHDIVATLIAWQAAQKQISLATVVQTWGSAPRQVGAKMGITADMEIVGSVSGGCVETVVIQEALEVLVDGQPRLLHFGVSDETAWSVGLACGGELEVYVERLHPTWWSMLHAEITSEQFFTTLTVLRGDWCGQKILVKDEIRRYTSPELTTSQQQEILGLASAQTTRITTEKWDLLVEVYQPPPQIVIVGGVHVAAHLQVLAAELGFNILLIDPRRTFATPERFPKATRIFHDYPPQAFTQINWTANTYLIVLSHDPKIDDPALEIALLKDLPYIGVMSSRATHRQRIQRLQKKELTKAQLAQIRTPIGLNLNAQTPAEIALSIMAEIVAVRNQAPLVDIKGDS